MIFGKWNSDKILQQQPIDLPISPVAIVSWEIQKVTFQQWFFGFP